MSFTASYDTYVVLGNPDVQPLWYWNVWNEFAPTIDPLIKIARSTAVVRSIQYLPNGAGAVKFGRLGWKVSDHEKWTHGSPTNGVQSQSWNFLNVAVWAPSPTVCNREQRPPEVFLDVLNDGLSGGYLQKLSFNPIVVLAVTSEWADSQASTVNSALSTLRTLMSAKLVGHRRRPWGQGSRHGGHIQDLAVNGLFKHGVRHLGEPGFHLFEHEWTPV